jgi:predicted double-glycine peptidase
MATSIYNCGPAALATVLNKMGITTTQVITCNPIRTDESGTTMYGLAQAAQAKGLIAKGIKTIVINIDLITS